MSQQPQMQRPLHEQAIHIPEKIRSIVYLIGTLGFPIVIAGYILIVTSNDIRSVQSELKNLTVRIDDRPMELDKTIDFIVYLTDSLKYELLFELPELLNSIDLEFEPTENAVINSMSTINLHIEGFIRPIIRKHQRFSERFPSTGGNIASYFSIALPAEDIDASDFDAYLAGHEFMDFSESLNDLMLSNIMQFIQINDDVSFEYSGETYGAVAVLEEHLEQSLDAVEYISIFDKEILRQQFEFAIESAINNLRDQMISRMKQNH